MKLNVGAIIGLVCGAIGAAVGITCAFMADPVVGGIIALVTTGSFYLVYRVAVKPAMEYSRILKTGTQATATILSLAETGTRINNQPLVKIELEVNMPGSSPYTTVTRSVISYFQASQFQPGNMIPVMVDKQNKMKVVIIREADMPNPLTNASQEQVEELKGKLEEMEKENNRIRAIGIYCKAIVTQYTPMGVNVNGNNPLVTLDIQVLPENAPAFPATVKGVIAVASVSKYQPGEEIFVKYDPADKTKVSIEHS